MTSIDILKSKINLDDLSGDEQDLLMDGFLKVYPNPTKFITEFDVQDVEEQLKQIIRPVRIKRIVSNIIIFKEFRRYCNELYPDKPFADYLCGTRKLPERKIIDFKLFFVIDYFRVNNHLKKMFDLPDLQRAGLYSRKEDGTGNLIFYAHRLIMPYIERGEMVYLRARYFDKDNKSKPSAGNSKYIGLSNDSINLNHTKRFFNEEIIKRMFEGERLFIVEGELDAIAGESLGLNTIAIPGSQNIPSVSEFKKLLPFEIYLCGDNDNAGNEMINKVTNIFMDLQKEITLKQLSNKDLNEFLAA